MRDLKALKDRMAELKRLSQGWRRTLEVCERLRRREENLPLLAWKSR